MSATRLAVGYGVLHALVDLCTVTAAVRASRSADLGLFNELGMVVTYDLLAFALQAPLGVLVDRWRACRHALLVGMALAGCAVLTAPLSPVFTMAIAGVGNALFHLGAGARVLKAAQGNSAPAGIFVAPGALGLAAGLWIGRKMTGPIWPLAVVLGIALFLAIRLHRHPVSEQPPTLIPNVDALPWVLILSALMLSAGVRAFVGSGAAFQCSKSMLVVIGLPLAAFLGKLLGGVVSDRLGWMEVSVGALVISAPFIAFNGGSPYLTMVGVLFFQATMPVTLTAAYLLFSRKPATAFGLICLALIVGALPTFFPLGKSFYGANTFLALIATSAVAIYIGLDTLGIKRGFLGTRNQALVIMDRQTGAS